MSRAENTPPSTRSIAAISSSVMPARLAETVLPRVQVKQPWSFDSLSRSSSFVRTSMRPP